MCNGLSASSKGNLSLSASCICKNTYFNGWIRGDFLTGSDSSNRDLSSLRYQQINNLFLLPLIPRGTDGILSLGIKMKWYVILIFSAGETQRRNRKNVNMRKENGILLQLTSRGRKIPRPSEKGVKNPKHCDSHYSTVAELNSVLCIPYSCRMFFYSVRCVHCMKIFYAFSLCYILRHMAPGQSFLVIICEMQLP